MRLLQNQEGTEAVCMSILCENYNRIKGSDDLFQFEDTTSRRAIFNGMLR